MNIFIIYLYNFHQHNDILVDDLENYNPAIYFRLFFLLQVLELNHKRFLHLELNVPELPNEKDLLNYF